MAQSRKVGGLYGPRASKGHLGVCAIYSEPTVIRMGLDGLDQSIGCGTTESGQAQDRTDPSNRLGSGVKNHHPIPSRFALSLASLQRLGLAKEHGRQLGGV